MERPGFLNAYFMLGKNVFLYVTNKYYFQRVV